MKRHDDDKPRPKPARVFMSAAEFDALEWWAKLGVIVGIIFGLLMIVTWLMEAGVM